MGRSRGSGRSSIARTVVRSEFQLRRVGRAQHGLEHVARGTSWCAAPRRSQLAEALREQEKQRRWEAQHVCPFVLLYVSERLMFVSSRRFVFLMAVQHRHIFTVIVVVVRGLGANRSSAACVERSNHRMRCMKISAPRRVLMILSAGSAGSASSRICDSDG